MDFLAEFNKSVAKIDGVITDSLPPRYWSSIGNFVVNKIMSSSYVKGIPQGRITTLAGPSGCGKSFLLCNIMREAQQNGTHLLVFDSENALDDDFVGDLGVDVTTGYNYCSVITISHVQKIIATFLKSYRAEHGNGSDGPRVMIALDSVNMLMTESEFKNSRDGKTVGDQGQKSKQVKALLRNIVQEIKNLNISVVITVQVYANQDMVMNPVGKWIINDGITYSASQIMLLTKLKLRDDQKKIAGIRMKVESFKSRFSQPYQTVTIEVPYATGMSQYSGLLAVAVAVGVVTKKGGWHNITGESKKWYEKDFAIYQEKILKLCVEKEGTFLEVGKEEEIDMSG